jgi:hypothetical protein
MEPINVKMKMADPAQVTALIAGAVQECAWLQRSDGYVHEVTREINLALTKAGCVIIQVDNSAV